MGWMGPGEHEGWVVPLFADGAEGAGASGGRGILIAGSDDEWRPDDVVVGYAAGCECGWRGEPWTRVRDKRARLNAADRVLVVPGPHYELDEAQETAVIDEWRAHIAPFKVLDELEDAAVDALAAVHRLDNAVVAARGAGCSWADIGRATGMTRQSANERWSGRT